RAWIFGLTCLVFKTTYIDTGKPLWEDAFFFTRRTLFLRWIRGILTIRRRACVSRRKGISGGWAYDALALQIEGRIRGNSHL
ncbi:hypothetical protein, partial [uncultured Porphyromonas sp.]|uniref:hypothetical protein n=1 Tax=uncultured Porphyromonas sp. TaxID=159274 RepID=UPI00258FCE1A